VDKTGKNVGDGGENYWTKKHDYFPPRYPVFLVPFAREEILFKK